MEIFYQVLEELETTGKNAGIGLIFFVITYLIRFGWLWAGREFVELSERLDK